MMYVLLHHLIECLEV